jgi:GWxTD domain-containing protein
MKKSIQIAAVFFLLFSCKTTERKPQANAKKQPTEKAATVSSAVYVDAIASRFLNKDSTTLTVFMRVDMRKPNGDAIKLKELTERFTLNYVVYPDFASRERLAYANIMLNEQSVVQTTANQFIVRFDVKKPANITTGILLSEIAEIGTGKKSQDQLNLRFKAVKLSDRFTLFNSTGTAPLMRNYVNVNDTVMLADLNKTQKKLYLYYYNHSFDAAVSPMNLSSRAAAKNLIVDTTMVVTVGSQMTFKNEGLYFMLEDTTDSYGIGIVVVGKRFPKLTRPEELAPPVMYVSQNQEIAELTNTKQTKKALDRYWLSLSNGNADAARHNIQMYYDRVEEANRLFTSYKEGWKTDKGMIYVVMGAPDRVTRGKDREVWVYSQRANFSEVNFTFNRRQNQFVEDHYELQRYVEYQPIWYPMVEAWRSGAMRD